MALLLRLARSTRALAPLHTATRAMSSYGRSWKTNGGRSVLREHHVMDYELDHRKPLDKFGVRRDEILVTDEAPGGYVVLNRARRQNAIDLHTVRLLDAKIKLLDHAKNIRFIMLRGSGPNLCGGADFKMLYEASKMGTAGKSYITSFFREQAQLNFILANARTSIMSFLHGSVTSGSAAGISMHGKVRLASPNVQFSMPECRLGYVPDGGSTYLLSRLPGLLGWYIALTGHTLNSGDLLYSGLATHAIALDDFTALQQILMASEYDDHMEMNMNLHFPQPVLDSKLYDYRDLIRTCFAGDSVEDIMARLRRVPHPFAQQCVQSMEKANPVALKVTHRLLSDACKLDLAGCLRNEYRAQMRMTQLGPFLEGVRAFIVDKDQKPQWAVKSLAEVTPQMVENIVKPFESEQDELTVKKDGYAEIFHETYTNYEQMQRDTQSFIGGTVAVDHDWQRTVKQMPDKPKPGQTGGFGW